MKNRLMMLAAVFMFIMALVNGVLWVSTTGQTSTDAYQSSLIFMMISAYISDGVKWKDLK
jgi:hypothetical protein